MTTGLDDQLDRWVRDGPISVEQAWRIREHLFADEAAATGLAVAVVVGMLGQG